MNFFRRDDWLYQGRKTSVVKNSYNIKSNSIDSLNAKDRNFDLMLSKDFLGKTDDLL